METLDTFAKLLGATKEDLARLDGALSTHFGTQGTLAAFDADRQQRITEARTQLGIDGAPAMHVYRLMQQAVLQHEKQLLEYIEKNVQGDNNFHRAVNLALQISGQPKGFFLKKSKGADILRACPPPHLLEFLGYKTVDELLEHHDVTEAFSALRFIETTPWMHETFDKAYSGFTADDFEERPIEIEVLGPEWHDVAAQFVAKKHHNVSHLKEFGVIFLNPIAEDAPGKFLRDFALLFHYTHEIEFYSNLFRIYSHDADFADRLKSLLRGDVKEVQHAEANNWLIVQRYLYKENPNDPRLFLPHVNPEALHWARAEQDVAEFGRRTNLSIKMWGGLDWVGEIEDESSQQMIVSYDMEDALMSAVESSAEGAQEKPLNYHQHEALWTQLFARYAGGEEALEAFLIKHFVEGVITL